jgi:C2 domain
MQQEEQVIAMQSEAFNVLGLVSQRPGGKSGHGLRVSVIGAKTIRGTTYFSSKSSSDSYAEVSLLGETSFARTATVRGTLSPQWNEDFNMRLSLAPAQDVLDVTVKGSHSIGRDDFIGRCIVPVCLILKFQGRKIDNCWFKLLPARAAYDSNRSSQDVTGSICLGFEYFFEPSDEQRAFLAEQQLGVALAESRRSVAPQHQPAPPQQQQQQQPQQQREFYVMQQRVQQPPMQHVEQPQQQQQRVYQAAATPLGAAVIQHVPPPEQAHVSQQRVAVENLVPCPVCAQPFPERAMPVHVDSHFPHVGQRQQVAPPQQRQPQQVVPQQQQRQLQQVAPQQQQRQPQQMVPQQQQRQPQQVAPQQQCQPQQVVPQQQQRQPQQMVPQQQQRQPQQVMPQQRQQHPRPQQQSAMTMAEQEARMMAAALAASEEEARRAEAKCQEEASRIVAPAPLSSSALTSNEVRVIDELRDRLTTQPPHQVDASSSNNSTLYPSP